ncbi:MAG: DUF3488 and transglutaminase-like domain-containing protein [Burkholderiaceae bacterium]
MNLTGINLSMRAITGRLGSDWERDRRDTLFLMAAILLASLPQLPHLPGWIGAAFLACFGWRLAILLTGRPLPATWIRVVGALAAVGGVLAQYQSMLGRDQGVALLTLFLGLKLLEMKARRDLFVVIFLCFFLLLTGFFQSQSLVSAALILFAVVGLVASMITMQFGQTETGIAKRLRQAGMIVLQALPIAIALFVLFPRLSTPLWGMQGAGAGASTGLSDSMSPGAVTNLAKSSETAFRVSFDGEPPPTAALYWRGPVFGQFDGSRWTAYPPASVVTVPPQVQIDSGAQALGYSVTLEPSSNPWLLALDIPVALEGLTAGRLVSDPAFTMAMDRPVVERIRYRAQSHLRYAIGRNETLTSLQPWLRLPDGFNPRTLAMAREWRDRYSSDTTAELANRLLGWFRSEPFHYTLQPAPLARDTVDDFLFNTRAGFCEHYTSAFVVLMRAMGIPARVVTGYQGAERSPVDAYYLVRQSDAHAWAEIWSAQDGWQRVDPTGAVAPERVQGSFRLSESLTDSLGDTAVGSLWSLLRLNLDALTHRWNQWVLNYDRGSQQRLLERLGLDGSDWQGLAGLLAGALVVLIGGSALLTLQPRPVRDPIGRAYDEFCAKLDAMGLTRAQHETATRYLARVSTQLDETTRREALRIIGLYNRLRYGDLSNPQSRRERRMRNIDTRRMPGETRKIIHAHEGMRRLRAAVRRFQPGNTPVDR